MRAGRALPVARRAPRVVSGAIFTSHTMTVARAPVQEPGHARAHRWLGCTSRMSGGGGGRSRW